MRDEQKLLIETSKLDMDTHNINKLNMDTLDWNYVIEQSSKHSTLPLLYRYVKDSASIPVYYKWLLESDYLYKKMRGEVLFNDYKAILDTMNKKGIKVIVLKGVFLAKNVYPDVALRFMNDMDILIDQKDYDMVYKILRDFGYLQAEANLNTGTINELSQDRLKGYENELQHYGEFTKMSSNPISMTYFIDVHHRLSTIFDEFAYNIQEIIARAIPDKLDDIPIYRMDNEDYLTHLCSHLYWHTQSLRDILNGRDANLLMYCDIRSFVHTYKIDWETLFLRAKEAKVDKALYYALYHCQQIYGDVVPEFIYKKWDQNYLQELSYSIHDRWITRNANIKVGTWKIDFLSRLFDSNRGILALESFYNEYLEPVLHRGGIFKIVERDKE